MLPYVEFLAIADLTIIASAFLGAAAGGAAAAILLRKRNTYYVQPPSNRHDLLHKIVHADPNLIFVKDAKGRFVFVNEALADAFGLKAEEIIGRPECEIIPNTSELKNFDRDDKKVLSTGETVYIAEELLTHHDGSEHWLRTVKLPILDDDGKPAQVLGISVDITTEWEQRQRLAEQSSATEHSAELKSAFLATMSHEIRTPLNSVIGFSELLMEDSPNEPKEFSEYLEIINSNGQHLLRLINSVLDMSKLEAGQMDFEEEPYELRQTLAEVIDMFSAQAKTKGIKLSTHIDSDLPLILEGDSQKLVQVLINLVGNAMKFTEEGHVRLSANLESLDSGLAQVIFTVSDTGAGIAAEEVGKVFESYAQAKGGKGKGTGLGLAISKQIIEAMGGTITCESKEGIGTTFSFTAAQLVPVDQEASLSHDDMMDILDAPNMQMGMRVLIVENDEDNSLLTQSMVERFGCTTTVAGNGHEALDILKKEKRFDLIFMDVNLAKLDGIEATKRIRKKDRATFIVALTAATSPEDRRKCLEAGMNFYLPKPVSKKQIQSCLHTVHTLRSLST